MIVPLALLSAAPVSAADCPLMKNGAPAGGIVLDANAGIAGKHVAVEWVSFLAKISGGKSPAIGGKLAPLVATVYHRFR